MQIRPVLDSFHELGFPEGVALPIGLVLLIYTILYAIPRTSVLGAILLTGYLGGAVATNVHAAKPLFGYILFPVYIGIVLWLGLYLRENRLRALVPLKD